jgi:D-3-phosphoglycerate dehydrogenase
VDGVTISRAGIEAIDRLRPLWLELHHHHQAVGGAAIGPYVDDAHSWTARRGMYARLLAEPHGSFVLLAERSGEPVGYAMVAISPVQDTWLDDTWQTGPLIAEIETVSVTAAERGHGIGSALLDRIDTELAEAGIADVVVGAFAANAGALRLYERRGYRPAWNYLKGLSPLSKGSGTSVVVALLPGPHPELERAVADGGGTVGPVERADAVVLHNWGDEPPEVPELPSGVRWIQLPAAGVENWLPQLPDGPVVTSATGAFALPVAEHAFALLLAAARRLDAAARATSWDEELPARSLEGATIAIVGAGGIGRALIELLAPLRTRVLAVNRSGRDVPGAAVTVPADRMDEVLPEAEYVVLAAPDTAGSRRLFDAARLARLRDGAWVINVGRGTLVDTDALVAALDRLGGAALDVTDPEPLPDGHPLWTHERVLITPHVATTEGAEHQHYAQRVRENVRRFAAAEWLLGVVDRATGY